MPPSEPPSDASPDGAAQHPPRTGAPARRLWFAAAALAVVVAGALLARPGTAADEDVIASARASLEPAPVAPLEAPSPPAPPVDGALVVRADGVDGLRLGMSAAEVVAAGFAVQQQAYDGCRRVLPGLADNGPGEGVAGWLVDDRVAAVTVDRRAGEGSSFLGPGIGDPLDDLPAGDGLLRAGTDVRVPWRDAPVRLDIAWVAPDPGSRVSFVDVDSDVVIDHVQVLADAGRGCAEAYRDAVEAEAAQVPVLDLGGWGDLRLGTPLAEARGLVSLQDDRETRAGTGQEGASSAEDDQDRCRLLLGDDEPGLVWVVVGDGVVRAVAVDAGRTDAGLNVGDPPERVRDAYPPITAAYLGDRWQQGLGADWQLPGGILRLSPAREQVRVPDVDAVLTGPRQVVGVMQVGEGC